MGKTINSTKFYHLLEWIMWLAYINLLWVLGAALGLLVLGIFPATVAMFTVIRDLLINDGTGKQILKTFITTYKKEFIKSNIMGVIVTLIGFLLYVDFTFIQSFYGSVYYIFNTGLLFISIIYLLVLLYLIPVYVHYRLNFIQYFKHAVIIGIVSPIMTIIMLIGLVLLYLLVAAIPGLLPFITTSTMALILMSGTLTVFRRMEKRKEI